MIENALFGIIVKHNIFPLKDYEKGQIEVFMDQYARLYYMYGPVTAFNRRLSRERRSWSYHGRTGERHIPPLGLFYFLIPSPKPFELHEAISVNRFKDLGVIESGDNDYLGIKLSLLSKESLEKEEYALFRLDGEMRIKVRNTVFGLTTQDAYFKTDFVFDDKCDGFNNKKRVVTDVSIDECIKMKNKIDQYVALFQDKDLINSIIDSYTVDIEKQYYYKVGGDDRIKAWIYTSVKMPSCPLTDSDSYLSLGRLGIYFYDYYQETGYGAYYPKEWTTLCKDYQTRGKERLRSFFETEYNSDHHKMALLRQFIILGHKDNEVDRYKDGLDELYCQLMAVLEWRDDLPRITESNFIQVIAETHKNPVKLAKVDDERDSFFFRNYEITNIQLREMGE